MKMALTPKKTNKPGLFPLQRKNRDNPGFLVYASPLFYR
jgi:hypothetical protein